MTDRIKSLIGSRGNILTTPLGWVYVDIKPEYFCMFRIPPRGEDAPSYITKMELRWETLT